MVSTICCDVGDLDPAIAQRVGEWAQAFHHGVTVRCDADLAHLSSTEHSEDQLRAIWLSSLANERLHARAATWRAATLAALVQ